jgi:hypothetical protein
VNFGKALEAVKNGDRARREFWNGRGMSIYLNAGSVEHSSDKLSISGVGRELFDNGDAGTVTRMPNINLIAADGTIVTGWAPSQNDMLADDWRICE